MRVYAWMEWMSEYWYQKTLAQWTGQAVGAIGGIGEFVITPDDPESEFPWTAPRPLFDVFYRVSRIDNFVDLGTRGGEQMQLVVDSYADGQPHESTRAALIEWFTTPVRPGAPTQLMNWYNQGICYGSRYPGYMGDRRCLKPLFALCGVTWPGD